MALKTEKQTNLNSKPLIRSALLCDAAGIHEAHMRSIREVCVKDHGEEEVKGWGHRELGDRWTNAIKNKEVLVVEYGNKIAGVGHLRIIPEKEVVGHLHALYLTPEVIGMGLGKAMMKRLLMMARELKAQFVELDSSITAYDFYKHFGFCDNGSVKKVEIGGHFVTAYPMKLKLV